jgi:hypothetical protein
MQAKVSVVHHWLNYGYEQFYTLFFLITWMWVSGLACGDNLFFAAFFNWLQF